MRSKLSRLQQTGIASVLTLTVLSTMVCQAESAADSLLHARVGQGLVNSPHNVVFQSPGAQVLDADSLNAWTCRLCHPASPTDNPNALWDRSIPARSDAVVRDASLCLSCHDGLLATGFSPTEDCTGRLSQELPAASGTPAAGSAHLLDWPEQTHGANARELHAPQNLKLIAATDSDPQSIRCITCHDPHRKQQEFFLRVAPEGGKLCLECHEMPLWKHSVHGNSPQMREAGLAEQACATCHQLHSSSPLPELLRSAESTLCLSCHDGSVDCDSEIASSQNLREVFEKPFGHRMGFWQGEASDEGQGVEAAIGFFAGSDRAQNVSCSSCHNVHAAGQSEDGGAFGALDGSLLGVTGVSPLGLERMARNEAEVCLKCHGFSADGPLMVGNAWGIGQDASADFALSNRSFHPVLGLSSSHTSPSLIEDLSPLSTLNCSDCHGNDDPTGAVGPHASTIPGLLKAEWNSGSQTDHSGSDALCAMCHRESIVLSTSSWRRHRLHTDAGFSCAACHDPHGSPTLPGLLNLDRRPWITAVNGEIQVEKIDLFTGNCTLSCHGYVHDNSPW